MGRPGARKSANFICARIRVSCILRRLNSAGAVLRAITPARVHVPKECPVSMITIKHIAERLDLSVSTVGRALTDHPRISRETKERVNLVAKELGYIANTAARVMRGGSSHLVGLLVPDIRSSFYSTVAQALSKQFEGRGFHLALSIAGDDRDTEMQQVRELLSARVAGIIIIPTAAPRRETLSLLKMVPHVQILRRLQALGDWFGMDDEHAVQEATNHLELGHRRVAFIGDVIFPTGKARYNGFP